MLIEQWRRHYNAIRPYSSLGYHPPAPETILPPAGGTRETEPAVIHGALIAFEYGTTMKWLVTILAAVVGILGLAYFKHVDTSSEALRVMAEARKALQHCEATKRKAALEVAAPTFRNGTLRMIAVAPASTFQDDTQHMITVDAPPHNSDLEPKGWRHREVAKRECGLEATRLGKAASLWCAGL